MQFKEIFKHIPEHPSFRSPDHPDQFVHIEEITISEDITSFPIRLPFMFVGLVTEGMIEIGIDLNTYQISKGDLLTIRPNNAITAVKTISEAKMMIMVRDQRVPEEYLPKVAKVIPMLISSDFKPAVKLSEEEVERIKCWFNLIKKLGESEGTFQLKKLELTLEACHIDILEMCITHARPLTTPLSRKEELMSKFLFYVSRDFIRNREVNYYANLLCITPKHLGTIVKSLTGRTPAYWINLHVTTEAQIMLKTTDKTIKEIASELNFPSQSHFGKFFRAQTGDNPSHYRHKN